MYIFEMVSKTAIRLQRVSKTYCQGETIAGTLEVETDNQEVAHEGITIHLNGIIAILRSKMRSVSTRTALYLDWTDLAKI